MSRKVADCRDYPSERGCTLTISGEQDEVLEAATQRAMSAHRPTIPWRCAPGSPSTLRTTRRPTPEGTPGSAARS